MEEREDVDVVVIGAGFCGLYATRKFSEMGLSLRAFDAASDVGGVWTWNRYPGCRTDSIGYTYAYPDDVEFLKTWNYDELHPRQELVLEYLSGYADRYDLRRHYSFETRVSSLVFDEEGGRWTVETSDGKQLTSRFVVTGLGLVSAPIVPSQPGIEEFGGEVYHTAIWPSEPVSFDGKRVAVIGTGSSGVQLITSIADEVGSMVVFQRTPNWVPPTGNVQLTPEDLAEVRDRYEEVWQRVRNHPAGWPWELIGRNALDTPPVDRDAIFEECWNRGGFSFLYETFDDLFISKEANDVATDWMSRKIASIVEDPKTAGILTPRHPYGAKRPPAADGYYATFNRENVSLVSLSDNPIVEFTPTGIRTAEGDLEFDVIIFATGFDAITGAFTRMDIRGRDGVALNDLWSDGPHTYLGLTVAGFPNFFMVAGPQTPFANLPPGAAGQGAWIADLIAFAIREDLDCIEPTIEAQDLWTQHLNEVADSLVTRYGLEANSWFAGANIEGKARAFNVYFGGFNVHQDRLEAEAGSNYPSFKFLELAKPRS